MMAETFLLQAINAGLQSIRSNTSKLLPNILNALNSNELSAAEQWFGNANNQIFTAPGFPMDQNQLPFIGVTVANETQISAETGIGYAAYFEDNGDGTWSSTRDWRFQGTLKCTIYSPNASLIIWLSAVVKWCLMSQIDFFDENGMNGVQISVGDFEPSPEFLPVFTFARGVFLSGEYDEQVNVTEDLITGFKASGTYSALEDSMRVSMDDE